MTLELDMPTGPTPDAPRTWPGCDCPGRCTGYYEGAIIGCGSEKTAAPSPAAELYTGSLYRAHARVLASVCQWAPSFIVSAKHGAIFPHIVIGPYEEQLTAATSRAWGRRVAERLLQDSRFRPGSSVLVCAGAAYVDPWAPELRAAGVIVDEPLRGMELGDRIAFAASLGTWSWGGDCPRVPGEKRDASGHSRCWLYRHLRHWRTQRAETRRRETEAAAAQVDMFGGTA